MKYDLGEYVYYKDQQVQITAIGNSKKGKPYYVVGRNFGLWVSESSLQYFPNRSSIGKKAYRTFIKNGGSRNSKGQFSKKDSRWQKNPGEIWKAVWTPIPIYPPKKQKIDWKKIGEDMEKTYWKTDDLIYEEKMTKGLAKVFQKHGLISKEVEI